MQAAPARVQQRAEWVQRIRVLQVPLQSVVPEQQVPALERG